MSMTADDAREFLEHFLKPEAESERTAELVESYVWLAITCQSMRGPHSQRLAQLHQEAESLRRGPDAETIRRFEEAEHAGDDFDPGPVPFPEAQRLMQLVTVYTRTRDERWEIIDAIEDRVRAEVATTGLPPDWKR